MNNMLCLVNIVFLKSLPRRNPKDNFSRTWPTVCDKETANNSPKNSPFKKCRQQLNMSQKIVHGKL